MILVDTSGLLAAVDAGQRLHKSCARALLSAEPPFLMSPFVMAELDYLLSTRVGGTAQVALLEEIARGAYQLEPFGKDDVDAALLVIRRFEGVGLADASIVVLAQRHNCRDVLTLDERHFRALRGPKGKAFRLLPSDLGNKRGS